MKTRILAFILTLCLLTCLLCSCGEATPQQPSVSDETTDSSEQPTTAGSAIDPANAKEITVGIAQDLDSSLDPYLITAAGTREVMFNVYEGLVKPDKDGNYVPAVASDVTVSDDLTQYTFTLREGVVFHNGKTCTIPDVMYSFDTCVATTVDNTVKAALSALANIDTDGQSTITFTLSEPSADFLSVVAGVAIVPERYIERSDKPIGTGPFKFVSRSVQENVVLERHADYYGTAPQLDRVTYKIYENANALFTALNSGALDLVAHLTIDQCNNLSNGYDVIEGTMNLVQALYLNNAVAPFDNVKVRQALCYAVDVDEMLALTAAGHGTKVGSSMYPAFGKYFDPELANAYPHDEEKAKALLTEAGYENGFSFTIKVPSNYQPHVDTATVLCAQLARVGITATLEPVDWNTWLEDVYSGRQFEGTVVGFDTSTLTAGGMLARWCSDSSKNMIGYSNADYDAAYAAARSTADDSAATAAYKQCLQILSDDAANVYLQDMADFIAINPKLKGYTFYPLYVMDMSCLYWEN